MPKIITFGEIMMRLNPEGYRRIVQADRFETSYAGGEANVAVSLVQYGMDTAFVSKVPAHEIGQAAVNALRRYGVDTAYMLRGGPRLGTYYVEKGASQLSLIHIYRRAWFDGQPGPVCPLPEKGSKPVPSRRAGHRRHFQRCVRLLRPSCRRNRRLCRTEPVGGRRNEYALRPFR